MLEIIKSFFSPVGGGRTSFASQNGNIQRKQFPYENYNGKEELRQEYNNSSSNSDFNRKRIRSKEHIEGGEEYLKSSYGRFADGSNASVLISSSFASENIVGGGQLRSNNYSASSRSIKGKRAYAHFKGGEGNYASLMSSGFADTETMLTNSDFSVGGGRNPLEASASGMQAELVFLGSSSKKGGKPFNRLASYTRNDLQKGGGRLICHLLGLMFKPSFVGGVF